MWCQAKFKQQKLKDLVTKKQRLFTSECRFHRFAFPVSRAFRGVGGPGSDRLDHHILHLSIYLSIYLSLCMDMYVCMYVCTHACMHACMYVRMYVCMHMNTTTNPYSISPQHSISYITHIPHIAYHIAHHPHMPHRAVNLPPPYSISHSISTT